MVVFVYIELSTKSAFSVEGSRLDTELSTISAFSVEGSRVDAEPSMIWGINVEGSVLENGTVRGFGLQRGWFRSGRWTFHDAGHFRGRLGPEEWNLPRFRTSARRVPLWMLNLP